MRLTLLQILFCILSLQFTKAQQAPAFDTLYHYKNNTNGQFEKIDPLLTANQLQLSAYGWQSVSPCLNGFSGYALASAQPVFNPNTNPYVELRVQSIHADFAFQLNNISLQLRGENVGANFVNLSYSTDGGITWVNKPLPDSPNLSSACGQTNSINWTPSSFVEINGTTGLIFRIYYFHSAGFVGGNNQLLNLVLHGAITSHSEFYSTTSGNFSDPIWNPSPFGTVGYKVNFTPEITAHIQNSHHVTADLRNIFLNNLFVNSTGRLLPGSFTPLTETNIHIQDLLSNLGIIGDTVGSTFISLIPEGASVVFQGSGAFRLGRIGKSFTNNPTTSLFLNNCHVSLRYPGNCIYNNATHSTLNLNTNNLSKVQISNYNGINGFLKFGDAEGNELNNSIRLTIRGELLVEGNMHAFSTTNSNSFPNLIKTETGAFVQAGNIELINNTSNSSQLETGSVIHINYSLKILQGNLVTNNTINIMPGGSILHGNGVPELFPFPGGEITGNVFFRATGSSFIEAYNYWSSPVNSSTLSPLANAVTNNGGSFQGYYYDPNATTSNTIAGLRAGWTNQPATSSMNNAQGYICRGARNVIFEGNPNDGTITQALYAGPHTSFNLIGNPYPGPINTNAFLNANILNITPAIYLWDDDNSSATDYSSNDYIVTNAAGTVATGGNLNNASLYSGNIAACQSFFIEKRNTADEVIFNNSMRNSAGAQFFDSDADIDSRYWFRIENESNKKNEILIAFADSATDTTDELFDAKKIKINEFIQLSSIIEGEAFAINTLSTENNQKTIPLLIYTSEPGVHKFILSNEQNHDASRLIYFYDNLNNHYTLLNKDTAYLILPDSGEYINRFFLIFNPPISITTSPDLCRSGSGKIKIEGINSQWQLELVNLETQVAEVITTESTDTLTIEANAGSYQLYLRHSSAYNYTHFIQIDEMYLSSAELFMNSETFLTGDVMQAELLCNENDISTSWYINLSLVQNGEANALEWLCVTEGINELIVNVRNSVCDTTIIKHFTVNFDANNANNVENESLDSMNDFDIYFLNNQLCITSNQHHIDQFYVEIFSPDGKLILNKWNSSTSHLTLNINEGTSGLYLIRISDKSGKTLISNKIILN